MPHATITSKENTSSILSTRIQIHNQIFRKNPKPTGSLGQTPTRKNRHQWHFFRVASRVLAYFLFVFKQRKSRCSHAPKIRKVSTSCNTPAPHATTNPVHSGYPTRPTRKAAPTVAKSKHFPQIRTTIPRQSAAYCKTFPIFALQTPPGASRHIDKKCLASSFSRKLEISRKWGWQYEHSLPRT